MTVFTNGSSYNATMNAAAVDAYCHVVSEVEAGQVSYCRMPRSSSCAAMEISMSKDKEDLDTSLLQLCHRTSQQLEPHIQAAAGLFYYQSVAAQVQECVCERMNYK